MVSNMDDLILLPCPFCGNTDVHYIPDGGSYWTGGYVQCDVCGAEGPLDCKGKANWNNRR